MGKTDSFDPKTYKTNRAMTDWQAIDYSEKVLDHKALMMLFLQSDVGWVNSLKDGMNLVAKEYIAAQNPDDPGVLLLSRYAGAAEQMQDAVIIDPLQPASIIQGLRVALTMPLGERQLRYQKLLQGLQRDDLQAWQQRFLDDLYKDNGQQTQSLSPEQSELPESQ
jgi:trehalose 6-phosphate synthase